MGRVDGSLPLYKDACVQTWELSKRYGVCASKAIKHISSSERPSESRFLPQPARCKVLHFQPIVRLSRKIKS